MADRTLSIVVAAAFAATLGSRAATAVASAGAEENNKGSCTS
jgi:hypothetical protein